MWLLRGRLHQPPCGSSCQVPGAFVLTSSFSLNWPFNVEQKQNEPRSPGPGIWRRWWPLNLFVFSPSSYEAPHHLVRLGTWTWNSLVRPSFHSCLVQSSTCLAAQAVYEHIPICPSSATPQLLNSYPTFCFSKSNPCSMSIPGLLQPTLWFSSKLGFILHSSVTSLRNNLHLFCYSDTQ